MNVISEFRKINSGKADKNVVGFFNDLSPSDIYMSELRGPAPGAVLCDWMQNHAVGYWGADVLPIDMNVAQAKWRIYLHNAFAASNSVNYY